MSTKFTQLPAASAQDGTEILAEVQSSTSKQVTSQQIAALVTGSGVVNAQTGTTYTLQTSDNGKIITLNNANPITLTCPTGLGAVFSCMVVQLGAGQVTCIAGGGATLNGYLGLLKLAGQYAAGTILSTVANAFVISGNTA